MDIQTSQKSVSVAVSNFNGRTTLAETLESVFAQKNIALAGVLLVDNNSTDDSVEFVQARFPAVKIKKLPANRGPNPARNEGLRLASSDLVLIMDNDIVLAPDYIVQLMRARGLDPAAGALTGQIRFYTQPDTVQYNGADIHYAGEIMLNRKEFSEPLKVGCVSAGAVLLDRRRTLAVGGFDEDFFVGWEDGDLTFRLSLAGFSCYAVSRAVCYHISRERSNKWVRYQTRNRWWFIGKNYDARTIFLALPALLLFQFCAFMFFLAKGQAGAFCRGTADALTSWPEIKMKRKAVQALKKIGDARLLRGERIDLPGGLKKSAPGRLLIQAFSFVFRLYWRLIRGFLKK